MSDSNDHLSGRARRIREFLLSRKILSECVAGRFTKLFECSNKWTDPAEFHRSKPGVPREQIGSRRETAFQRAIYYQRKTEAQFSEGPRKIEWLDIEVPVAPGPNPRRQACDLIGKLENGGNDDL